MEKTGTYVLNNTALRSWWLVPRAVVTEIGSEHRSVSSVTKEEFEFLQKEATSRGEAIPSRVDLDEYNLICYYSGYLPNAYNINSDKPVDSTMGILFNSELQALSENEASFGFDYVFVGNNKSAVTMQIGLYDKQDRQVALTEPINVPLQRSHHTILKGSFLMQDASGGLTINPEFDGNHNIVIE